jgi:integrase
MRYVVDYSYLVKRGRVWWYNRRVPKKFAHLDTRKRIYETLRTGSLDEACILRDQMVEADDAYWGALAIAEQTGGVKGKTEVNAALRRYDAAKARSLAAGFTYRAVDALAADTRLDDALERLLEVRDRAGKDEIPKARDAEAILGGADVPKVRVSDAFEIYLKEIAHDAQMYKSKGQRDSWEKTKRTSIQYFISQMGDLALLDISRDTALQYKAWWAAKITPKNAKAPPVTANTANRHIGNIRSLYTDYFKHIGEESRPNPFRNIHFKAKVKKEVPAFENDWVRSKLLIPGAMNGLKAELQLIIFILIETGCRPSEIINLRRDAINLDHDVPHLSIRARVSGEAKREVKTDTSERDIPLIGVALEAAKRAPQGFDHYYDRSELFSANIMKAFRNRSLFPSDDHRVYSLRHSFEKRMQEANIDYALRCLLMGHKNTRPAYGDGGSLTYRREEMLKIVHPFSPAVFDAFDAEHAEWGLGS